MTGRTRISSLPVATLLGLLCLIPAAMAADHAAGHFRFGDIRLDVRHAIAVVEEESDAAEDRQTLVFLSGAPLDAAKVAAAFDAMDAVREQEPAGGYIRLCFDAEGGECGLFFSPEGFNSGGYGELKFDHRDARRIAGSFVLATPEDFLGKDYEFDLRFDTAITAAPGTPLPAGGGEPGADYNAWLAALAQGDLATLRRMAGDEGRWRFPEDDATAAKESLKSLRDEQPLHAEISRGRLDDDQAILWVSGVDRDDIRRAGRVLMQKGPDGWRHVESDLDSVDE